MGKPWYPGSAGRMPPTMEPPTPIGDPTPSPPAVTAGLSTGTGALLVLAAIGAVVLFAGEKLKKHGA